MPGRIGHGTLQDIERLDATPPVIVIIIATLHKVADVSAIVAAAKRAQGPCSIEVVIVDNGPGASSLDWSVGATIIVNEHPLGSTAFLEGLVSNMNGKWDWVLFIDDDIEYSKSWFEDISHCVKRWHVKLESTANNATVLGISTNGCGAGWSYMHRWTFLGRRNRVHLSGGDVGWIEVDLIPWNGMLLNHAAAANLDQGSVTYLWEYFFGWDDYALCRHLKGCDVRIYGTNELSLGNPVKSPSSAQAWRVRYNIRNAFMLASDANISRYSVLGWVLLEAAVMLLKNRPLALSRWWWESAVGGLKAGWQGQRDWGVLPALESSRSCSNCGGILMYDWWVHASGNRQSRIIYGTCRTCGIVLDIGKLGTCVDESDIYADSYPPFQDVQRSWIGNSAQKLRDKYVIDGGLGIGSILACAFPDYILTGLVKYSNRNAVIVDIGCGRGELLQRLNRLGYSKTFGFDPYAPLRNDVNNMTRGGVSDARDVLGPASCDVVIMNHVLEHVQDQQGIIASVSDILKDGGVCIVRVPIQSWAYRKFRSRWPQLERGRHVAFHCIDSLKILCETVGSLKMRDVWFDSNAFQFPRKSGGKRGWSVVRSALLSVLSLWLNRKGVGDQVCVVFQKVANGALPD